MLFEEEPDCEYSVLLYLESQKDIPDIKRLLQAQTGKNLSTDGGAASHLSANLERAQRDSDLTDGPLLKNNEIVVANCSEHSSRSLYRSVRAVDLGPTAGIHFVNVALRTGQGNGAQVEPENAHD